MANGLSLTSGMGCAVTEYLQKVVGTSVAVESMRSAIAVRRVAVQLFPVMGHEFVKPALLPSIGQLLEHIGKVWQRRHSVLGTGTHQAIQCCGSAGGIV